MGTKGLNKRIFDEGMRERLQEKYPSEFGVDSDGM
jgi:hypothetical protein